MTNTDAIKNTLRHARHPMTTMEIATENPELDQNQVLGGIALLFGHCEIEWVAGEGAVDPGWQLIGR